MDSSKCHLAKGGPIPVYSRGMAAMPSTRSGFVSITLTIGKYSVQYITKGFR